MKETKNVDRKLIQITKGNTLNKTKIMGWGDSTE